MAQLLAAMTEKGRRAGLDRWGCQIRRDANLTTSLAWPGHHDLAFLARRFSYSDVVAGYQLSPDAWHCKPRCIRLSGHCRQWVRDPDPKPRNTKSSRIFSQSRSKVATKEELLRSTPKESITGLPGGAKVMAWVCCLATTRPFPSLSPGGPYRVAKHGAFNVALTSL